MAATEAELAIPATVPANAGNGLVPGTTIDKAFLLAHNPGLSIQQIDNAIIPRLGRPSDEFGSRDRINAVLSAEWRPSDALHFYVDGMYGWKKNDLQRIDMDLEAGILAGLPEPVADLLVLRAEREPPHAALGREAELRGLEDGAPEAGGIDLQIG